MIVKTFFGTHLDLSKVVMISDAEYDEIDGGFSFSIVVQLKDEPIVFWRSRVGMFTMSKETLKENQLAFLQRSIDDLVRQWKQSKELENVQL